MKYISLGFSCQTRFSINGLFGNPQRFPFDFNITTRQGLLECLRSGGSNFLHSPENATKFLMTKQKREGIYANGIFFWHDYPNEGLNLAEGWEDKTHAVSQKYEFLWDRFIQSIRSDERKVLIVSNTQHNLIEFSSDSNDFNKKFGLDMNFIEELRGTLDGVGAKNLAIHVICRNINESFDISRAGIPQIRSRFWGATNLPTSPLMAASTLIERGNETERRRSLERLVGSWDSGCEISLNGEFAYATLGKKLWAEISPVEDGYIFSFDKPKSNSHFGATLQNTALIFSNKSKWKKLA